MKGAKRRAGKCILAVFSHPDDETTSSAGTFTRYAREGVEIYVATATRGEQGTLGTGGLVIRREDLPAAREAEMRSVLELYGVHPPIFLGYQDQEVINADFEELVGKVVSIMERVKPDVVITWGPTGISHHDDHIAIHRAAVEAFHRYRTTAQARPRLFYVAIPEELAKEFELNPDESEMKPTVLIDTKEDKQVKIKALRMYRSQEDAQEVAEMFETSDFDVEAFHQAFPPPADSHPSPGFWD